MAHVPLDDNRKGIVPRLARLYTKRRMGQMVDPAAAASHHSGVLVAMGCLETAAQFGWKKLDPTLRWLAVQTAASKIGCSWCVDYGYYEGMNGGLDPAKVRAASEWRESELFDDRERVVLEYAEVVTRSPAEVTEEPRGTCPASPQRPGVRGVGGLGRSGELPVPLQCRTGAPQPGILGPL